MIKLDTIYNMDCLEGMKVIPDGSVDAVICDLPYGTTSCKWDVVIPFVPLWEQYHRVCKPNAPIVLFSQQPFTSFLLLSNIDDFKYEIIWEKTVPTGFLNAKKAPMRIHENILVFYANQPTYNPQMHIKHDAPIGRKGSDCKKIQFGKLITGDATKDWSYVDDGSRYPTDIVKFSNWNGSGMIQKKGTERTFHPTQKPVDLLRYLVLTYTNEGDTVLDNCMGSGTTAIACIKERRHFIGFELNKEYFDKAQRRIDNERRQLTLF